MDFKEIAEQILDRSDLEGALQTAYAQGRADEKNSWWRAVDKHYEETVNAQSGYFKCEHNPTREDDK